MSTEDVVRQLIRIISGSVKPTLLIISGVFGYAGNNTQTSLSSGVRRSKSFIKLQREVKVKVAGDIVRFAVKSNRLKTLLSASKIYQPSENKNE